jgi:hypothetical protein
MVFGATAMAQNNPTVSIVTEYLMTVDFPFESLALPAPRGIVNIPAGGTDHGPKINGIIIPPGGDWAYAMPDDGTFRLDVRFTIRTDDGELILAEYNAAVVLSKEVLDKFAKGETINSNEVYWISAPRFTTSSKRYAWLNGVQAAGKLVNLQSSRLKYDIFVLR